MIKIKFDPRSHLIFALTLIFLISLTKIGLKTGVVTLILCLGGAVSAEMFLAAIKKARFYIPYSALITGLILTLIIDPFANPLKIIATALFAIISKHFIRAHNRHLFNPAAFGLFLSGALLRTFPSWWSVSMFYGTYGLILNLMLYTCLGYAFWISGYKYKRYYTVLAFLATYLVANLINSPFGSTFDTIFSPGFLFFVFVMLPEPMTSPVIKDRQIKYGIFVAALAVILSSVLVRLQFNAILAQVLADTFISALVMGNWLFFKYH